jgi:hypothetical protein
LGHLSAVSRTEEFDAPASAVWRLLADWPAIVDWMPGGLIASLRMEGQGTGAIRHIVTGEGVRLSERLDAADEVAGTLDLSLVGQLPWGLLSYRARGTVVGMSPESCRLTWHGVFETPAVGEQADRVAHLLKRSYESMFLGVRREVTRRRHRPL